MQPSPLATEEIIERALHEDVGDCDLTTTATVAEGLQARAAITAKAPGVVAGLFMVRRTYRALNPEVSVDYQTAEGARVTAGTVAAAITGPAAAILTGERTALNFLQRMSGIATRTARYVDAVEGTSARICDTRKTAPGLRVLDKYAVRAGGGVNHRFGLYDAVLLKENHLLAAGGVEAAVRKARQSAPHTAKVEVETETLDEVREAVSAGADIIMLDNMSVETMREAVKLISGRAVVEASGNVSLETVRPVAETGVDLISVGELTHSVQALDFSLRIVEVS